MGVIRRALGSPPARWLARPRVLSGFALASVIVNIVIVVTGGVVRLTGSGLGCPTWPQCTSDTLTPTHEYAIHGVIEFTNRQLTFVVTIVVALAFLSALAARRERALATALLLSIPAQAVLGGITVLTHLNPWAVASHFLLSMAIIAVAFALWWRARPTAVIDPDVSTTPRQARLLVTAAWILTVLTAAVLAIGTVVTGTGPHAGDKGATHRIHFSPASASQLHADVVMLLIGVTIGFLVLAWALPTSAALRRAAAWLLGVELAQGTIGFVQYFTHVPAVLVGFHMFGACLVWVADLVVLARARSLTDARSAPDGPFGWYPPEPSAPRGSSSAAQRLWQS